MSVEWDDERDRYWEHHYQQVPTYAPEVPFPGMELPPFLELMRDSDGTGWVDCITCHRRILQVEPGWEREVLNLASDRHQSCRP